MYNDNLHQPVAFHISLLLIASCFHPFITLFFCQKHLFVTLILGTWRKNNKALYLKPFKQSRHRRSGYMYPFFKRTRKDFIHLFTTFSDCS